MSWLFDYDDGDMAMPLSDDMAMDSDGDLMMRMGDNMAMDIDSGELHITSAWDDEDDYSSDDYSYDEDEDDEW